MFGCDLRQISGGPFVALFVDELYADAVHADLPVEVIAAVLEVPEYGDGDAQFRELIPRDRVETGVLEGARYGVLTQSRLKVHSVEGAYAAAELLVLADFPGDEEGAEKCGY